MSINNDSKTAVYKRTKGIYCKYRIEMLLMETKLKLNNENCLVVKEAQLVAACDSIAFTG